MSDGLDFPKEWLQPHPVIPLPSRQVVAAWLAQGDSGRAHLEKILKDRAQVIALEKADPLRHGYKPEIYGEARGLLQDHDELLLMGQNRSGKTDFASDYVVDDLVHKPNRLWICFEASEKASIDKQQPRIHAKLPPEWRSLDVRSPTVYLHYGKATGFTNFKFILPNLSTCLFGNYKQDVGIYEGYEFDGAWFDELVPLSFVEAMTYRVGQGRRMVILITFTPVRGYTAVVGRYVAGAKIIKTRPATLLPPAKVHVKGCQPGHMPYALQCRKPEAAVLFFHFGCNPFGANKEVQKKTAGTSESNIKIRCYGWADKMIASAFPKYSDAAHLVTRQRFEEVLKHEPGTWYMSVDPRPGRNWFIKWYFVHHLWGPIVAREWPDLQRFGEWAIPPAESSEGGTKVDWRPGPAQSTEAGRGLTAYKALILEAEGWTYGLNEKSGAMEWNGEKAIKVHRRLMDPRMGGSEVPSQDEGETLIQMMENDTAKDSLGRVMPGMIFEAAPASSVHGAGSAVEMIVDAMSYDDAQDITPLNCPHWYVVDDCKQTILTYQEFTNGGTSKDALKDPVDCDRYFVKAECGYVAPRTMSVKRGGYF